MMYISYIDPGTGSMLISAGIALISVVFFMLKGFIFRLFNYSGEKGEALDVNRKYGLVFFSEGKQYWNVFYPLLEECSARGIKATYMTSGKDDPALKTKIDGIDIIYIGSGRESFYVMNRLKADMVVMTTPGLDVLELKRSKDVKHYSHLTHAMGSVAGYKSYAVDYFDSVLLGGDLDIKIIRELEELRDLPEKEIEVVGHTYVDALRETLTEKQYEYTYFEERKPTILLSPTWGNHGLLRNYGEELLTALEKDNKYNVIVRAHPQSFISEKDMIEPLMEKFPNTESRVWDRERENLKALSHADIMISDFSGITFDFYTLFKKPILTMNAHYEKRGRDIIDIEAEPWDVKALDIIGKTIYDKDINNILEIIEDTLENFNPDTPKRQAVMSKLDKYPKESRVRTVDYIENKLDELRVLEEASDQPKSDLTDGILIGKGFKELFNLNSFVQYALASGLLVAYIYLIKMVVPIDGLNHEFLNKLMPLSVKLFFGLISFVTLCLLFFNKDGFLYFKKSEKFKFMDGLLVFLPMTPILQYILSNQDILNFRSSALVFGFFFVVSFFALVVLPKLLSVVLSKSLVVALTTSLLFIVFNMADFGRTTLPLHIGIIFVLLSVLVFFLLYYQKQTILVFMSIVFFATTGVSASINKSDDEPLDNGANTDIADDSIFSTVKGRTPERTPNVYVLVYDAYLNEETMNYFDYDNSDQYNYLLDNGFAIYDGTYSIGASSITSMAHVFGLTTLDNGDARRRALSGDGVAFKILEDLDYYVSFLGSSDYMTKGFSPTHDFSFPGDQFSIEPHKIIINAILEGEFRFDVDFSEITYRDYLNAKKVKISEKLSKPKFFHSHDDNPGHSQNSGVLRPDETDLYIERLISANGEMKNNIDLIKKLDPNSIIVVMGDHGAYLTKNGIGLSDYDIDEIDILDIQDRYGTFLAISWPETEYIDKFEIDVIQDVMPAIFAYIYNDDALYEELRMGTNILHQSVIGGVDLRDGKLYGGKFNGDRLFEVKDIRYRD